VGLVFLQSDAISIEKILSFQIAITSCSDKTLQFIACVNNAYVMITP
jgi:hypothetical protein